MKLYYYAYRDSSDKQCTHFITAESKKEADDIFFSYMLKNPDTILDAKMKWKYICLGELKNTYVNLRD